MNHLLFLPLLWFLLIQTFTTSSAFAEEKKAEESKSTVSSQPESKPRGVEVSEETPTDSKKETKSIGFWKYPAKSSGAWKLLPDISVIGVFSGAYFTQDPGPSGPNPYRTGFNLQEIEVAFQSVIDPYVRGDVFLVFQETGVELEEGYITTLSLPRGLQLRAGKYKLPFGRQNPLHTEIWPFVDDNLINNKILGPDGLEELGFETSYLFPTPFFLQLQTSVIQGSNTDNFNGPRRGDLAYAGRLVGSTDLTDHLTFLMGASTVFGFNSTAPGNKTNLIGGDLLLKWRPSPETGINWQTEYIYRRRQIQGAVPQEGGFYSYLMGQWTKRWGSGFRFDYLGIPNQGEKTVRLSPLVFYGPTEFFRIRVQYEFIKTAGLDVEHAGFLQMIFNMGPHGAHQF